MENPHETVPQQVTEMIATTNEEDDNCIVENNGETISQEEIDDLKRLLDARENYMEKHDYDPFDNAALSERILVNSGIKILNIPGLKRSPGRTGIDCDSNEYSNGEIKKIQVSKLLKGGTLSFSGGPMFDPRACRQNQDAEGGSNNMREKLSHDLFIYGIFLKNTGRCICAFYILGQDNNKHIVEKHIMPVCTSVIHKVVNGSSSAQAVIKRFAETLLNETDFPEPELNKVVIMNKDSFDEGEVFNLDNLTTDEFQQKIINIYK
jgi:hypothetical protein